MNWKVKTKDYDNTKHTFYVDSLSKKEIINEFNTNESIVLSVTRNYQIFPYQIKTRILKNLVDEWHSLINTGFDEMSSLEIVKDNCVEKKVKTIIESILFEIKKGYSIDEAFEKKKKYFPNVFIEVLKVSIKSNSIRNGLFLLSNYLDDQVKSADKIKNVMIYPKIIGVVTLIVLIILSKYIIPSYSKVFNDNDIKLDKISQLLIKGFNFIGNNLQYLITSIIVIIFFAKVLLQNKFIKILIANIRKYIPFINKYFLYLNTYLFSSMTNLLWKNNINKADSIKIVIDSLQDNSIKNKLKLIYNDIKSGTSFGKSFTKYKAFDAVFVKMLLIGEKNDMISQNMENAVEFYKYKCRLLLERAIAMIEPLLLIFLSLFVLIIILVVFIPMLNAFKMVR